MTKKEAALYTSDECLKALQNDVMYRDRPIVRVSFNDNDPDIYARLIEHSQERVQMWMTPDGLCQVNVPQVIVLYYLTPQSNFLCGDAVGKETSKIKSIQFLN